MKFIKRYSIWILAFYCLLCLFSDCAENEILIKKEKEKINYIKCDSTIVSVYWAVANQTDDTPTITASGFKIIDVNNPPRICAVPRNLIGTKYEFGDSIFINADDQYLKGWWRIEDVMNNRYSYCDRIDLLVKPNYLNKFKTIL